MIIDTCTYVGHWPYRKLPCETLREITEKAEKRGTTHIICTNLNGIFYIDSMEGNREFYEEFKNYNGSVKVLPTAVINPNYIEWERDIIECKEMGFKGIALYPLYHGYSLKDDIAKKAYKMAGDLGLFVKLDAGFENIRQRNPLDVFKDLDSGEIVELLKSDYRVTTIISSTFLNPSGTMGLTDDVRVEALKRDNVFFNMIYADSYLGGSFEAHLKDFTPDHLVYGTQAPFRYMEPQLIKMFTIEALSDEAREKIFCKNLLNKISDI